MTEGKEITYKGIYKRKEEIIILLKIYYNINYHHKNKHTFKTGADFCAWEC
jgi:hypothetical protein